MKWAFESLVHHATMCASSQSLTRQNLRVRIIPEIIVLFPADANNATGVLALTNQATKARCLAQLTFFVKMATTRVVSEQRQTSLPCLPLVVFDASVLLLECSWASHMAGVRGSRITSWIDL